MVNKFQVETFVLLKYIQVSLGLPLSVGLSEGRKTTAVQLNQNTH